MLILPPVLQGRMTLWITIYKRWTNSNIYTIFVVARLPCPRMREYYPQDLAQKARFLLYTGNIGFYILRVYH